MSTLTVFRYLVVMLLAVFLLRVTFWLGLLSIAVAIFLAGTLLFSLNRRSSDYVSLLIFGFGLVVSLVYFVDSCLKTESFFESVKQRLSNGVEGLAETLFLLLSVLSVLVLTCTLCSMRKREKNKLN